MSLTFMEAVNGVKKSVSVFAQKACKECKATGAKKGSKPVTCATCNGSGATIFTQGFFQIQQECQACGGAAGP